MEKFYVSKSGKYTGILVGEGKKSQCLLDEKSKDRLALDNVRLINKQK